MEFDSLSTYITLAKKVIAKFGKTMYPSSVTDMLKNEDVIGDVANALMYADWKWDATRVGHEGKSKTKYSYRNQCAIWAIKTFMTNKHKKNKFKIASLLDKEESSYIANIPCKNTPDPHDNLCNKESEANIKNIFEDIFSSDVLNEKQKQQIIAYYYKNKTLAEIGKDFGVTREAIRQNIQKGIMKIKSYV